MGYLNDRARARHSVQSSVRLPLGIFPDGRAARRRAAGRDLFACILMHSEGSTDRPVDMNLAPSRPALSRGWAGGSKIHFFDFVMIKLLL